MILKNWYKALECQLCPKSSSKHDKLQCVDVTGQTQFIATSFMRINIFENTTDGSNAYWNPYMGRHCKAYGYNGGVVFGNGTDEVTFDDYKLSGDIITTVTVTLTSFELDRTNERTIGTAKFSIVNTGTSPITISEVGLCGACDNETGATIRRILYERTLLDSPITIEPDGVGELTYTIQYNPFPS